LRAEYWGECLGRTWKEVSGALRNLYVEELHNVYFQVIIIQIIKTRRTKLAELVAHTGDACNVESW
jgi:hypothetical protein